MRLLVFYVFFLGITLNGISQRFVEPDKMKTFNITINYDDFTVKTQMLKDPKKLDLDPELTYCWYSSQKIIETKGGFDGKLLHGYYHSFYLNSQLRESGEFKYGVKHNEWKTWYPDGKLKEITHWKNGRKKGEYALYNEYGTIMAKGSFKNDLLNGDFYTYNNFGKVSSFKKYKNGVEIITPEKTDKKDKSKKEPKSVNKEKKSLFKRKPKKEKEPQSNTKTTNI